MQQTTQELVYRTKITRIIDGKVIKGYTLVEGLVLEHCIYEILSRTVVLLTTLPKIIFKKQKLWYKNTDMYYQDSA